MWLLALEKQINWLLFLSITCCLSQLSVTSWAARPYIHSQDSFTGLIQISSDTFPGEVFKFYFKNIIVCLLNKK